MWALNPKTVNSQGVGCDEQREQGSDWGGVDHRHAQARPLTNRQGNLLDDEGCEPPPRLDFCAASVPPCPGHVITHVNTANHVITLDRGSRGHVHGGTFVRARVL